MGISSIASKGWKYIQRAGKLYPDFVLGTGNEAFSKALSKTVKNRGSQNYFSAVLDGTKKGIIEAEKHNANMIKRNGGFWKNTWKSLSTTPGEISQGWKAGGRLADRIGKTGISKIWTQCNGAMKGLGKKMPVIGTILIAATELPNIISAFKDDGIIGGLMETGKSGLRLGAGMAGAAIGQALIPIPIVGSIVGYIAGDWLMSKLTGKSHSEKKAEAEQAQQEQLAQQQINPYYGVNNTTSANPFSIPQPTLTPQQLMAMQQMLYNNSLQNPMDQDFMAMTSGINKLNYLC